MSVQVKRLLGREMRYQVVGAKTVDVKVETNSGGKSSQLKAELIDMSQGGVRLRSKAPVVAGDVLTIAVAFDGFKGATKRLTICGHVCWTTPARQGFCYLGCSIEPPIPQVLLDNLAASGILERRSDERQEMSITLPAKWECDQTELSASILNFSDGGMCLLMPQMRNVGDRIRLALFDENQKETYLLTTVCWQIETDDGHVLGCDFEDRGAYQDLKHLADLQCQLAY